ncbi:hypothetical protein DFH07DRAFT_861834 [Mycena maculata]|uniref:Zinc finger PHD-type domain-containing protein n=1 Tax=Mycena maculata TaxID=230809 RepID=A0AAD7HBA6_9AGAR|nr:hypothetical protein DFH07DRAFT_861834 [Mycena maculata]
MPRRAAPRPAELLDPSPHQDSPIPSSSDVSSRNLAILRTHWKWAAFSQFFFTFSHLFAMEDVSLSDIEDDLARGSNIFLPRVMARLLFVLSYDRKVSLDNWQAALRKQHNRRDPASNPIGPEPYTGSPEPRYRYESVSVDEPTPAPPDHGAVESHEDVDGGPTSEKDPEDDSATLPRQEATEETKEEEGENAHKEEGEEERPESKDWLDLPMLTKLDSMHLLTEWQFQNPTRLRTLMKSDDDDATWRIEPIGYDAKSNAYWLIGADRLWIQRVQPKPPRYAATTSSLKRKRPENATTNKAKGKRPATKRARLASEEPAKLTITVPGGGRAAKAQAKLKLDAQAKELAELNRAAGVKPAPAKRSHGGRNPVATVRPLGTRVSARLRGADDDEWQEVPEDWLNENEDGSKQKHRAVGPKPKTGLECDDESISDLTELSEEALDDEEDVEQQEQEEEAGLLVEEEASQNNREDGQPDGFVEWETICVTLSDWEHVAERFEKGTHYTEKSLYKVLVKNIVPVITEELREIERKRRIEEAIVHRKRSSRIANKESEKEEARMLARQKAEVEEKKTRAQRLEARLAKEEAERERREAVREQRRKEKEAQEAQSEEADDESPDMNVDVVGDDPPPVGHTSIPASRRNGTAPPSTSTSGTRTPKGEDWVLNCEICHRSGVNADDGVPMLCCGLCSQWQHIACHDRADVQAGRPRRNWDHVDFICRQCQARRIASKNASQGQYIPRATSNISYLTQAPVAPVVPPTSYAPYGHGPPPPVARAQRDYSGSYPVAVNGATAYAQQPSAGPSRQFAPQPTSGTSRQLPYPTSSSGNYHQQGHPVAAPPPRPSAGSSYNAPGPPQQYHQAAYDRSSAQFQQTVPQIAPNHNGHRAPAYQRPVASNTPSSWNMPPTGYNASYQTNGSHERHQYGDGAQWHAGGSQQTAAFGYHNGQ